MQFVLYITGFLTVFYSAHAQFRDETIMYNLENMEDLRQFGSWARESLEALYTSRNPLTVFAFNDTGFATLPSQEKTVLMSLDAQQRREYVRSFTVNQKFGIANLYDGQELDSIQGRKLYVNKKNVQTSWTTGTSRTFINGGMIVREEIQCSNGIIHVLDRPLSPLNKMNILEYIEAAELQGGAKTLKNLIDRLYYDYFSTAIAPLSGEKKMTFFMPAQQALERIPDMKLSALAGIQLAETFQMHYIPKLAVFTNVVDNYQSFTSGNGQSQIIFHKVEDRVSVSSGGVTAQIIRGNITLANGVLHVIDRMLGFVYNTAIEQIGQDANSFNNFIQTLGPETKQLITQSTGLNMFVPMDMAFTYVRNLPGINIDGNITLKEMVVKLSIIRDGALTVTKMGDGNYESRQRRVSYYNNQKLVIYNDRNETWVNGGNTRAKIIRPDVGCTTGSLQYLDRLLGIPIMDIPTLIYYDDYLLLVYYEMVRVHLDEYLRDKQFDRTNLPPRGHEPTVYYGSSMGSQYGYNSGPGGQFQFTTMYPNQYPTFSPGEATQHPNNIPNSIVEAWYQSQGNYGAGQNQYGQNQYNQGQNQYNQGQNNYGQDPYGQNQFNQGQNQYGNQYNQGQNQYGNQYNQGQNQYGNQGQSQYGQNQYNQDPSGYGQAQYNNQFWCDFPCGDLQWGCKFTFFVPNGTALENFYFRASYAQKVINDACRFKFILRRLIIPHRVISLEEMMVSAQPTVVQADTGELISIRKESENDVRILWGQQSARVIMWDLGATNGIVHIIDQILSDQDDEWIDISGASGVSARIGIVLGLLVLTLRYIWR